MDIFHTFLYLSASILFILSLRSLSSPKTAKNGNMLGMIGMLIALFSTLSFASSQDIYILIALFAGAFVGISFAAMVNIKALPETVAVFNGLGGASAVLISLAEITEKHNFYLENSIGLIIGALAFSGSFVAFLKLHNFISPKPFIFFGQNILNFILGICIIGFCSLFIFHGGDGIFYTIAFLSLILGILLVLPIGGADMPIIISLLNAYSGFAAIGIGFVMDNIILVIVGSLVGASGAILAYVMTKSMNRSLFNIITGKLSEENLTENAYFSVNQHINLATPTEVAFLLENASNIIIVVGYGLAAAQAQNILKKLADILIEKYQDNVRFAIHPVAGRMPGHMNVLLAEAGVEYDRVFALEDINNDFSSADVVLVIGANDIINPSAQSDTSSPLFGMPVLEVWKAKTVFIIKRSLQSGYAGVSNPLFYYDNTMMVLGDAKEILEKIVQNLN